MAIAVATALPLIGSGAALALRWIRRHLVLVTVDGVSMAPALGAGDRLVARRVSASALRVGQIVVVERPVWDGGREARWEWQSGAGPVGARQWMIKRVAALPGDPLPPAVVTLPHTEPAATVPPGTLIVLGDNAAQSIDSRTMGPVPTDRVLGVALCRFGKRARQPTVWLFPPVTGETPAVPERRGRAAR